MIEKTLPSLEYSLLACVNPLSLNSRIFLSVSNAMAVDSMNCRTKYQYGAFFVNNVPATKPAFGEVVPRKPPWQPATSATLTNTFQKLDKYILQ